MKVFWSWQWNRSNRWPGCFYTFENLSLCFRHKGCWLNQLWFYLIVHSLNVIHRGIWAFLPSPLILIDWSNKVSGHFYPFVEGLEGRDLMIIPAWPRFRQILFNNEFSDMLIHFLILGSLFTFILALSLNLAIFIDSFIDSRTRAHTYGNITVSPNFSLKWRFTTIRRSSTKLFFFQ